jgi:hypothetical protein
MGGGATVAASRHGREQEGRCPWRGGAGEGRGGARPARGGRRPGAAWAGRGWMAWAGWQAKAGGVGRPAGPSGLNSEEEFFSNKN